jgi:hypothetical protein
LRLLTTRKIDIEQAVGGVLIDLHSEDAKRELTEKYGLSLHTFSRLTRSCFESYPRSITELAMIGEVGTDMRTFLESRGECEVLGAGINCVDPSYVDLAVRFRSNAAARASIAALRSAYSKRAHIEITH